MSGVYPNALVTKTNVLLFGENPNAVKSDERMKSIVLPCSMYFFLFLLQLGDISAQNVEVCYTYSSGIFIQYAPFLCIRKCLNRSLGDHVSELSGNRINHLSIIFRIF